MDKVVSVEDNFLEKEEFDTLSTTVMSEHFPWVFNSLIHHEEEPSTSPGQLVHVIYSDGIPQSSYYDSLMFPIRNRLKVVKDGILLRIKVNLRLRLPEPFHSNYHVDIGYLDKNISVNSTTSILYINTNNGYTEFEDGTIVHSVANRLATFPLNTRHRGVTQTDEQTRCIINFNYLKGIDLPEQSPERNLRQLYLDQM